MVALSSFLLCGMQSVPPASCNEHIGPSTGEVVGIAAAIGAVIVVGTVVLVEVHKSHHTIKGCVTTGPSGLTVVNESDKKTYALTGVGANVKVGDIIKVNGNKEKKQLDSAGNEDFVVTKMNKDYGPCKAALAATATSTAPAGALAP
jgi:hypothetical protein